MTARIFLLVDDDPDDIEMFCEALAEIDNTILCYFSSNGKEAFLKLDTKVLPVPDIIFLDINMPQMNGWRCLEKLKQNDVYKNIPVFMYSTSSNPKDKAISSELGALRFFTKPNSYSLLKQMLESVLLL